MQWTLLGAGLAVLCWCGFVMADARYFQANQSREFDRMLSASLASRRESVPPQSREGVLGRIEIERLRLSVIVVEGSTESVLRRAAGHISGTAMPGQPGNVGISAHRDTFFRPLRDVQNNDVVVVTTLAGAFRYRVVSTSIVTPETVSVLEQGNDQILTLVTCYPFYFVGEAPSRFIVRAERMS
jgi:sortase A